jgi:hypothetical protein
MHAIFYSAINREEEIQKFVNNLSTAMDNSQNILFRSNNIVIIYTALRILLAMEKQLGLEAMLDYHRKYLQTVEGNNPMLKHAVNRALSLINVEKIYKESFPYEN